MSLVPPSITFPTRRLKSARAAGIVALAAVALSSMTVHSLRAMPLAVTTFHNDNNRSGANTRETILTTANVNARAFGRIFNLPVDGQVYAQALYVQGVRVARRGVHNVLYVATMHNSLYAYDADTGVPLWKDNFGRAIPSSEILAGYQNCDPSWSVYPDMGPEVGITSTPVIDLATRTLYCLSRTHTHHVWRQTLHAISLGSGAEKLGGPVPIPTPNTATSLGAGGGRWGRPFSLAYENQRAALGLTHGRLVICWASHGDCGPYNGWVMSFDASSLRFMSAWCATPSDDPGMGGIWMSGAGPALDPAGNAYISTGNGSPFDGNAQRIGRPSYAMCIVKLANRSQLRAVDFFCPSNVIALNSTDMDLSSCGVLLIPGTKLAVAVGKEGVLYLMRADALGRFHASGDQVVQEWRATRAHIHGAPIYWTCAAGKFLYVWGEQDRLKQFQLLGGRFASTPAHVGGVLLDRITPSMPGGFLSLSSNGAISGTGIVWAAHQRNGFDSEYKPVPGDLEAYDAANVSRLLWSSRQNASRDDLGNLAKFVPPTVANGHVYAPTFSGYVAVYGLLHHAGHANARP